MSNQLNKCVRYALAACSVSALAAPAAFAQSVQGTGASAPQNQTDNASTTQLGKIEVTGTRILRTSTETAQPITIITAKQIQQTGLTQIGDILQNLTQAGAAINTLLNNGGNGSTAIDLRNFGSNRVLVLVNGRRWTPGISGTVDLNNIPSSVIDHIEILQDGASAIYGSDAITGVINIITVKNFSGAKASALVGMYGNNYGGVAGWDGKTQQYNFTVGAQGQRSGVVVSASYTEQDPIWNGQRVQSREPVWTQGLKNGEGWTPQGQFLMNIGNQAPPPNANCSPFVPAQPNPANPGSWLPATGGKCDLTLISAPTDNPTLENFRNFEKSDLYNFSPTYYFQTPLETKSVYANLHYDISDNVTFTSTLEADVRDSQQGLSPMPLSIGGAGFTVFNNQLFGVGANNPYNPFHENLVATSSQFCPTAHYAGGTATCTPNNDLLLTELGRAVVEKGPRILSENVTNYTVRMGLNGFFNALGNEWDWDLGSSYGNVYETDSSPTSSGFVDTAQLTTALDSPGLAQCNGPGQANKPSGQSVQVGGLYYPILIPGCVPMNFFGGFQPVGGSGSLNGNGSITPAMLNYVFANEHSVDQQTMRDYTANVTGTLAELPAGPLGLALGVEYLEFDGNNNSPPEAVFGNVQYNAALPTQGRQTTDAEYFELNVPLLSDLPMAKSLSLDVANRWSQFEWAGGNPGSTDFGVSHKANATTARAQMRWQTSNDLLLRASWAQGFRAPDLADLYSGVGVGAGTVQDPCAPNTGFGSWAPGTPLPPGCHGIVHIQPSAQIQSQHGGNPALTPEHSISDSVGFVYSPDWIPGFNISADYYKIDLGNVIGRYSPTYVMDQCYVQNNPSFCSRIITAAGGSVIQLLSAINANTGEEYERGVDVNANYSLPATAIGNFSISTDWTFVQSLVSVEASAASPTGFMSWEMRGLVGSGATATPQRKGRVSLNWNYGVWSASWQIQYIGPVYEYCSALTRSMGECSQPDSIYSFGTRVQQGKNELGTTIYHDTSVTYHADEINTDFTFGIRNLFNKQYPAALTANYQSFLPEVGYRMPGRFVYARVGVSF